MKTGGVEGLARSSHFAEDGLFLVDAGTFPFAGESVPIEHLLGDWPVVTDDDVNVGEVATVTGPL